MRVWSRVGARVQSRRGMPTVQGSVVQASTGAVQAGTGAVQAKRGLGGAERRCGLDRGWARTR